MTHACVGPRHRAQQQAPQQEGAALSLPHVATSKRATPIAPCNPQPPEASRSLRQDAAFDLTRHGSFRSASPNLARAVHVICLGLAGPNADRCVSRARLRKCSLVMPRP
eukprot:CAMPEP_0202747816 /NCGR_PEP_ID=MMETSP1388-20130828/9286_1 /ASSEMBLY_ACC=CAM_ASM_000864 /TAXON_ID=37098 /ORGANISM="Isochrysis sp, Strain CCMP1244" /LENGTH=108 /DNA_ID=CAMNT_0049415189 /DNA_START=326 /DNA_END=652 /DNA_ORIENTATION=+